MSKIIALQPGSGRNKRVRVKLDGKPAFSLDADIATIEALMVGQEISEGQIEALAREDRAYRCLKAAIHYLGYRPRSEAELKARLERRGFDEDSVQAVINRLKESGQIDDLSFAQFWKDNRESFSPRSQWLTKLELRRKGVATDIIDQVVDTVDNNDSAYRAALDKVRRLTVSDYEEFRRRLGGYLRRRGFNYEVISHTVEQLWREREEKT